MIRAGLLLIAVVGSGIAAQRLSDAAPLAVGAYITGAYFFMSSTSFRQSSRDASGPLSNTFAGRAQTSVVTFILAEVVGTILVCGVVRVLWPAATGVVPVHPQLGALSDG